MVKKGFFLVEFFCATLIFVIFVKGIFVIHTILEEKKEEIYLVVDGLRLAVNSIEKRKITAKERVDNRFVTYEEKFNAIITIKKASDNSFLATNKVLLFQTIFSSSLFSNNFSRKRKILTLEVGEEV